MKVLMTERFLPESIYSLELGMELKKYCDLTVFCKRNVAPVNYPELNCVNQFYTDGQRKWLSLIDYGWSLMQLSNEIKHGNYDIVHVQTFKSAEQEMTVYRKTRKYYGKLVHTVHNILPHEASQKDRIIYRDFYNDCDRLIVHNEATKRRLVTDYQLPKSKIAVIPHGAYKTHMDVCKTCKENNNNSEIKNYLFFGNIRHYKGIDLLLEAVALLPEQLRNRMRLVIAGKQYFKLDATNYREKIETMELGPYITFYDEFIPEAKIQDLFNKADVAVFPYREIYASGALLMAYSYGKPVIASDIPVFVEETNGGKTGALFEAENAKSLADTLALSMQWDTKKIADCQREIQLLIYEKYNWEKSASKTIKSYLASDCSPK